jgi:hypothetical protein
MTLRDLNFTVSRAGQSPAFPMGIGGRCEADRAILAGLSSSAAAWIEVLAL